MHVYTCKSVKYVKYMYIHLKILLFFLNPVCVYVKLAFQKPDTGIHVYVPLSNIIKKKMMGCKKSEEKFQKPLIIKNEQLILILKDCLYCQIFCSSF